MEYYLQYVHTTVNFLSYHIQIEKKNKQNLSEYVSYGNICTCAFFVKKTNMKTHCMHVYDNKKY